MAVYTVLEPATSGDLSRDAERIVFVREGFSWGAFVVPILWLVWHRMWLVAALWLVAAFAIEWAAGLVGDPLPLIAAIAFAFVFAFEANALRRWTLQRRGCRFAGVVAGSGRDECERRFFATWLIGRRLAPRAEPPPAPWDPARTFSGGNERIIGLFPSPERPR